MPAMTALAIDTGVQLQVSQINNPVANLNSFSYYESFIEP